jgi:hypothetical protein
MCAASNMRCPHDAQETRLRARTARRITSHATALTSPTHNNNANKIAATYGVFTASQDTPTAAATRTGNEIRSNARAMVIA